ncbi:SusC/RagA family TonB-linked outer membrane protein [Parafilimonas terrae]|uniref:TonB-linked outer membrane protein, SusC/RagA family n=1 Tax=Parafilimonas terrae TaxID=1465490 RepID=A0A1I5YZT4_9BACT|nr:SusC/RagA family TonB-linked outer membrane protein [Parafilimonas terrae]SFQ49565.1 TonB-linked outer membrane protein, SusC/RagA family [Parafilimonas terrae]
MRLHNQNRKAIFRALTLLLLLLSAFNPKQAAAQTQEIKGVVRDSAAAAIAGATVSVNGTKRNVITANDGSFTINAAPGDQLRITAIGFSEQIIPVSGKGLLTVTMLTEVKALSDVVVIGYGSQRRADVTSAVASVKQENFIKGPVQDAGQLIQGKVAGLTVSAPSGDPTSGTQILLRGNTTLFGANTNPLVLVDGVPGSLTTVAPEDIESIDVLKDGSAAAIYGVRGTNGVILITTKRASGNNINTVEYNGYVSTETIARKLDMLTAADYREQIKEGIRDASWDLGSNTDWLDEITRTPVSQVHNITFRGGNSKTNYLLSLNYRALQGIFLRSNNNTFTGRADINHNMFDDKLKLNLQLLNQNIDYIQTTDGGSFNGYTYRQALIYNPTSPVKNEDGTWFQQVGNFNYENPLSRIYETSGKYQGVNTRINANLTYTPVIGLKLNALFSYSRLNNESGYSETKQHVSTLRDGLNGYAAVGSTQSIDRLTELTAEYTKSFKDHRFSLLGGYGYQENEYFNFYERNYDFPTDIFDYSNIQLGNALKEGKATLYSYKGETNLISFFGRLQYSFADKYLLLASIRREAASQLYGAKKPWGTFPSVSVGWHITKEGFMLHQTLFDDLKLRAGYGVTGNPPASLFLGVAQIGYGSYNYSNGQWIQTLAPTQNANPYLKWEEKQETNIGLDFSMLKGRISGSADYYIRRIKGLLYNYQVPSPPNLYSTTEANVGTMENKGFEVIVNFIPVQTKSFQWTTSVNFSTNSNKLISLSNDLYKATSDYFTTGYTGEPIQTFTHIVYIGKGIGDFYGFKVTGLDDNGKWIYEGQDGKPVNYDDFAHSFEDKKVIGNGLPKYYAGWNNNFKYKAFDLSITMRGAFKYQVLNYQRMYYENPTLQNYNRLKSAYDKPYGKALLTAPLEFNSYYIENGDFWKVDNIVLGYTFSLHSKYIKGLRLYASTINTLTITGYKGIDPEVNRLGLNPGDDDRDKYPTSRTYTFGVNVTF